MKEDNENIDSKNEDFGDKIGAHYRRVSGEEEYIKKFITVVRNANKFDDLQRESKKYKINAFKLIIIIIVLAVLFVASYMFMFKHKEGPAPVPNTNTTEKIEKSATNLVYKKVVLVCLNKYNNEESKKIAGIISDKYAANLEIYVNDANKYLNAQFKLSQNSLRDSLSVILNKSEQSNYDDAGRIIRNAFKSSQENYSIMIIGELPEKAAKEMQKIKKNAYTDSPLTKKSDWQDLAAKKGIEVVWISPQNINELTTEMIAGSVQYFSSQIKISTVKY